MCQDPDENEVILQTENLKKDSWKEELIEKYIKMDVSLTETPRHMVHTELLLIRGGER